MQKYLSNGASFQMPITFFIDKLSKIGFFCQKFQLFVYKNVRWQNFHISTFSPLKSSLKLASKQKHSTLKFLRKFLLSFLMSVLLSSGYIMENGDGERAGDWETSGYICSSVVSSTIQPRAITTGINSSFTLFFYM